MADLNASREMREILAAADKPLTVSEIFYRSAGAANTTVVAGFMHAELKAGRVTRTGTAGSYAYSLSIAGRKALDPKSAKGIEESAALDAGSSAAKSIKDLLRKAAPAPTPTPSAKAPAAACVATPAPSPGHAPPAARDKPPAPKHSAQEPPNESPDAFSACRLAGAVLCFWPEPLTTIPDDLGQLVRANLAAWASES